MARSKTTVNWPWFIVGCIVLCAAFGVFFWAFSLGDLTSSRRFLLMWLLPLASGFACGCFAGSLRASGPVGPLAVAATGGFAVWLLSYFLLPEIEPPKPPDSVSLTVPNDVSFRQVAQHVVEKNNGSAMFVKCKDELLNAKVRPGQINARNVQEFLETLRLHLVGNPVQLYRVRFDNDRRTYEICGDD
jgi:hypothetical protein